MPAAHCPVHYAQLARIFGVLVWLWLMTFERYNKKIKNLVGNKNYPISSLANALLKDAGHLFISPLTHAREHVRQTSHHHHPVTYTAAQYEWWTSVPEIDDLRTKTGFTDEGTKWVPSCKFASRISSLCMCCSNMQLRNSCTQHRAAIVGRVKVCHTTHSVTCTNITPSDHH